MLGAVEAVTSIHLIIIYKMAGGVGVLGLVWASRFQNLKEPLVIHFLQ